jgi:hypothetical protein
LVKTVRVGGFWLALLLVVVVIAILVFR